MTCLGPRRFPILVLLLAVALSVLPLTVLAVEPLRTAAIADGGITIHADGSTVQIRAVLPNVMQVRVRHAGNSDTPATLVLDPGLKLDASGTVNETSDALVLGNSDISVRWDKTSHALSLADAQHRVLLRQVDLAALAQGRIVLEHAAGDALYGIRGYFATEPSSAGILRSGVQVAKAGEQGYAGAPFVWSSRGYAVLVDARPARFDLAGSELRIDGVAGNALDYFLIVGPPPALFAALSRLSGAAPLFPKWAMGFTNSQWGIDQKELLDIVDTYRAKQIPIDNFTIDFDWKDWGKDDYGEFRWNARKFPGGPDGSLKQQLDQRGMHLTGIMKPRIHVDTAEGRYATTHDLWFDGKPAVDDYFSHKPVRDLDFDKPAARAFFFNDALKHSFDTGLVGWWNDEADDTGDDAQFMNMQRALYEGQRAHSPLRVWSLNRNFYLGAQRYGYSMWSGDIDTGFASMAEQRERMLSAVNLGEWKWGMDGGGFKGHPSDENYARWIEFGAFTPVFRVHGSLNEKRQPWAYGATAEAAATQAIRLRYALIPYIYSYERSTFDQGAGLVRSLPYAYPQDAQMRNDVDAWMFGDWLLVSPVVQQGQSSKRIYLPPGRWTDWFSGKVYAGGQTIDVTLDSKQWSDIPLFIRQGAIIPTQLPQQYVDDQPTTTQTVDVFPDTQPTQFDFYNDDGRDYAYEQGQYFLQRLRVQKDQAAIRFDAAPRSGNWATPLRFYRLRFHGAVASAVDVNGMPLASSNNATESTGWRTGCDRYGEYTEVVVAAGQPEAVVLSLPKAARP